MYKTCYRGSSRQKYYAIILQGTSLSVRRKIIDAWQKKTMIFLCAHMHLKRVTFMR